MRLTIEFANDEQLGPCYRFHGDADNAGLHSFVGVEFSLEDAFKSAKDCIQMELEHFGLADELKAVDKQSDTVDA